MGGSRVGLKEKRSDGLSLSNALSRTNNITRKKEKEKEFGSNLGIPFVNTDFSLIN